MYSKITALIRSNGSHFLTAGFYVEETYKVKKNQWRAKLLLGSDVEVYYVF